MEKGGEMMEYGRWRSRLQSAAPLPCLWRDIVSLNCTDLSRTLVVPPLAALRVLRAATTGTLRNRMKVALNIVSLFRLVVCYGDLTFGQRSYTTFGFSSSSMALSYGGMKM